MVPDKKISDENLDTGFSSTTDFYEKQLGYILNMNDRPHKPLLVAIAYFDLAHVRLANDKVDEARRLFREGAMVLISGGSVRTDIPLNVYAHGHTFPIYGYLGGKYELGRPLARWHADALRASMAGPGYLSPAQRIYEDFYLLLDELILDNSAEINALIESLDKRLSKFKIRNSSLYKPSGLYHKYPLFGKEMVKAILTKCDQKFSENLSHWSQLAVNVRSPLDTPESLVEIELVLLYDLALGKGMRPEIDTPFIPKSVIKNGYWNKPL